MVQELARVPPLTAAEGITLKRELRRSEARLEALLSSIGDLVIECDDKGTYLEVWTQKAALLVAPREDMIGRNVLEILPGETGPAVLKAIRRTLRTGESEVVEYSLEVPAGARWFQLRTARVTSPSHPATVCLAVRDVSAQREAEAAQREAEEQLRRRALYDDLTGLPNRALFSDRLLQELKMSQRTRKRFSVLMIDADHFKEINDTLGHKAGDEVLRQLAARLVKAARASDSVCRLGGDEFGVLLPNAPASAAKTVAARLSRVLEEPIFVDTLPLNVDVSIGAVTFPADGDKPEILLSHADLAMYQAKRLGSGFVHYDPQIDRSHPEMLSLIGELRGALERGEVVLYFQPQLSLETDAVPAVEILIRWSHPRRGLLLPNDFIPLVQETSLVRPLTLFVIDEALRHCRQWTDEGQVMRVGVNLAMRNLIDDSLPADVSRLLKRHGVPASQLELEITEGSVIAEPRRAESVLGRLSALGVRLSIDDFGTGYSSLTYLTRLPVAEVKIDKSFVIEMTDDPEKEKVVRSTIELAVSLGKEVVAEGVETEDVLERLKVYGCHLAQGYWVSRPLPKKEFERWLRDSGRLAPNRRKISSGRTPIGASRRRRA